MTWSGSTSTPVKSPSSPAVTHPSTNPSCRSCWPTTWPPAAATARVRSEEHTSELQSHRDLHSFPTRRSSDLGKVAKLAGGDAPFYEPELSQLLADNLAASSCDSSG